MSEVAFGSAMSLSALPLGQRGGVLWTRFVRAWLPDACRRGLHRVPAGIIFDIGLAVADSPVSWLAPGDGTEGSYRRWVATLHGLARRASPEPVSDPVVADAVERLVSCLLASCSVPVPPAPFDASGLVEAAMAFGPSASPPVARRWVRWGEEWIRAVIDHVLPREVLGPAPLQPQVEVELLERLPLPRGDGERGSIAGRARTRRGETRVHIASGLPSGGVDGIETGSRLEHACSWQFALGRRRLVHRIAWGELVSYRQPLMGGRSRERPILVVWCDPSSFRRDGFANCRDEYAFGKCLAGSLFVNLALAARLRGMSDQGVGLSAAPASVSGAPGPEGSYVMACDVPFPSECRSGLDFARRLPPLARFFSRSGRGAAPGFAREAASRSGRMAVSFIAAAIADAVDGAGPFGGCVDVVGLFPASVHDEMVGSRPRVDLSRLGREVGGLLAWSTGARLSALLVFEPLQRVRAIVLSETEPEQDLDAGEEGWALAFAARILDSPWCRDVSTFGSRRS